MVATTALLERQAELALLERARADARAGRGRFALIEAAGGVGKSSLLDAAREQAVADGFAVIRARASEMEQGFAYGCVRQMLEPVLARADGARREALLAGAAASTEPLFAAPGAVAAGGVPDASFAILHGLYWLVNNLAAEGPALLVLDDAHWADAASLRLMAYLAPRLDGLPVLALVSARPGEGDAPGVALLAAAPEVTHVALAPLSAAGTRTLAEGVLGAAVAPEFAAACHAATGGTPFFLQALLREVDALGLTPDADGARRVGEVVPASVAQAVLLRLAGAPAPARTLVRALAVLGDGASVSETATLAGLGQEEALSAVDALIDLAIITLSDRLCFVHPIVGEAVYADLGAAERAGAHARAARLLAAAGAAEERVAAQVAKAEPAGDAERVALLRRVAGTAMVRGAPEAAVRWLRRALAEVAPGAAPGELLLELGVAELRSWQPGASEHLAAAVAALSAPRPLALAIVSLGHAFTMGGDPDRTVATMSAAVDTIAAGDREVGLAVEAELAAHAQLAGGPARARVVARLARHADLAGDTPGERLVLASLAYERARVAPTAPDAIALLEGGLAGGRLVADHQDELTGTFYMVVIGLELADGLDAAAAALDQAQVAARARASIPSLAYVAMHQAAVALRRGAVAVAEDEARTALALLTGHGLDLGVAFAEATLALALLERGDVAGAAAACARAGDVPPGLFDDELLRARAIVRSAQGDHDGGVADLRAYAARIEAGGGGANPLAHRWRGELAHVLIAAGDVAAARALADEDLARAERWGAAPGIGRAQRARAAAADGENERIALLRAAVATLAPSVARLEHARALVELGAALRRGNRRAEARDHLREGLAIASACGATALAERAALELRVAGGPSSNLHGTGAEQLTVSERRVAELAAAGHSNPQIAQLLFVTRKTVETHLGRAYRKLDIAGRDELAAALAEA